MNMYINEKNIINIKEYKKICKYLNLKSIFNINFKFLNYIHEYDYFKYQVISNNYYILITGRDKNNELCYIYIDLNNKNNKNNKKIINILIKYVNYIIKKNCN